MEAFGHLGIRTRLTIGFTLLLVLMLITNLLALQRMAGIMEDLNQLVDERVVKIDEASHVLETALTNGRALRELLLAESPAERAKIKDEVAKHRKENAELLTKLESQLRTDDAKVLMARINEQRAGLTEWYTRVFDAAERGQSEAKQVLYNEFVPRNNQLIDSMRAMVELQEKYMHLSVEADRHSYQQARLLAVALLVLGFAIGIGAAFLITRSITRPLGELREAIVDVSRRNDFTASVRVVGNDEVGETAAAFNELMETVRGSLQQLKNSIAQVTEAAQGLAVTAGQSAKASTATSESASSMAATVEEVSVSVSHVSENARSASELAQRGGSLSAAGGSVIRKTVQEMHSIGDAIDRVAVSITTLGEHSHRISSVIQVIKDVADQTNLLALNAAIEAARAGEAGRGFAVVADEVRKLAERTTLATGEISEMVRSIQQSSESAVEAMRTTVTQVEAGRTLAGEAGRSITEIGEAVEQVVAVVGDIAESISEQSSASQSIAQQLEQVAQAAEENSAASSATSESATRLGQLAVEMRATTERFRV